MSNSDFSIREYDWMLKMHPRSKQRKRMNLILSGVPDLPLG